MEKEVKHVWELKKGDKVEYLGEVLTFLGMDGMYGKWEGENGNSMIYTNNSYTKKEDGTYIVK